MSDNGERPTRRAEQKHVHPKNYSVAVPIHIVFLEASTSLSSGVCSGSSQHPIQGRIRSIRNTLETLMDS